MSIFQASVMCHEYRLRLPPSLLFSALLRAHTLFFCTSTDISSFYTPAFGIYTFSLRCCSDHILLLHLIRSSDISLLYFAIFSHPRFFFLYIIKNYFCTLPNKGMDNVKRNEKLKEKDYQKLFGIHKPTFEQILLILECAI